MSRVLMLQAALIGFIGLCFPWSMVDQPSANDFVDLFNGRDLEGWKLPAKEQEGWYGPWTVKDGCIHCDVRRATGGDQSLWTLNKYKDFILELDWRIWEAPFENNVPVLLPDGTQKKDAEGKPVVARVAEADSGVYLRGSSKSQINIWCWPIGSGEVYGYRTDPTMSAEVRAGVTPKTRADKPIGEWNQFVITLIGDRLTVVLNGETVIDQAQLPGIPDEGSLALQHHGGFNAKTGQFNGSPSQVEFRRIRIKELPRGGEQR